ncbi:MAG: DUF4020 domain-containing protein [Candidatus Thiodiazotropha taylori]
MEFLTAGIVWFVENPNEVWLPRLITQLDDGGRLAFANYIGQFLSYMKVDERIRAWDSWLKEYWVRRKASVPAKLTNSEINAMLHWLVSLDERFPEGVNIAIEILCERLEKDSLVHELGGSGFIERFPSDVARLVTYMLRCDADQFYLIQIQEKILEPLGKQEIEDDIFQELNQALIASGREPLVPANQD